MLHSFLPALRAARAAFPGLLLASLAAGCGAEPDVVVYCALDQVHSEELLRRFERETGLHVEARFDVEANKTVGLVQALREERAHTRCDVFWNNEVGHTVALAREGFFAPYRAPSAATVPAAFRDPEDRWTGFAARGRVLIVNTEKQDPSALRGTWDLLDPRFAGRAGLARPLTGTTMTHMAALYAVLGEARAEELLTGIHAANARGELDLAKGNAHVMRLVSTGELDWGWTDTDDFNVARLDGRPVAQVVPDQDGDDALGMLLIPNTLAVLEGAPHPENARRLVDWLLRPEIEAELARSRSAQIPVRAEVERPEHVLDVARLRLMAVDYVALGTELERRAARLRELFLD